MKSLYPTVQCPDGLHVSVQASRHHYCLPREDAGPYVAVELGFPSQVPPEEILHFAESPESPTETVYGYVPVELVRNWLNAHGGALPEGMA